MLMHTYPYADLSQLSAIILCVINAGPFSTIDLMHYYYTCIIINFMHGRNPGIMIMHYIAARLLVA